MIVKICGITRLRDARFAAEAGADFLGFICYPKSPRYIPPEGIASIVSAIRQLSLPVRTVGVFVNESPATVLRVLDEAGLDLAQLHGDELPESIQALAGRAFKALRPT
ncbi:MAG: phosphoribosylanthranilate isomerase, partial [Chloroflexi bacterium]|nr:phosphoribosylanthranilate isomerase [Chloroflexota bacterium]